MNKDIQKRIADIIDSACGGNRSEFCRKIGRDVSAVKDIIGGKKSAPSYGLLYDILSSDLGISPTWLMLGDGPMLIQDQPPTPQNDIHHNNQVFIGNWDGLAEVLKTFMQK